MGASGELVGAKCAHVQVLLMKDLGYQAKNLDFIFRVTGSIHDFRQESDIIRFFIIENPSTLRKRLD